MTIEKKRVADQVVVVVSGRMDAENAPRFEQECNMCISEGVDTLVIDAAGLTYVSSMGLRCFVALAKTLKGKGGELRVCSLQGLVKQVFEITGLGHSLPVYDTLDSAVIRG